MRVIWNILGGLIEKNQKVSHANLEAGLSNIKIGHVPDFGYENVNSNSLFGTEKKGWNLVADSILAYPKFQKSINIFSKSLHLIN